MKEKTIIHFIRKNPYTDQWEVIKEEGWKFSTLPILGTIYFDGENNRYQIREVVFDENDDEHGLLIIIKAYSK